MNRSLSQTVLRNSSSNNDLIQRCVYINEEVSKKNDKNSVRTIFHSPYKDGRRNTEYTNPTFMTSDIISNRQFSPFSSCTPKKAVIHTDAQNRQKALYNQRMNRSQSFTNISQRVRQTSKSLKKKTKQRQEQRANQGNNTKVMINSTLQNQLEGLMKFRQERQLKQSNRDLNDRFFRKTYKKNQELPVYFQKVYQNPNYVQQQQEKRRGEIQEWMGLSKQLQCIRQQIKKERNRSEANNLSRTIQNQQFDLQRREQLNKNNAQLLSKILQEQIKAKQRLSNIQKRERGWKIF